MFVPKATARNPRRRQRTGSDDSVKPPKAKRQRSVLRQTEGSPPDVSLSRDHGHELAAPARPNDHDDVTGDRMAAESHLPIRNTKPSEGLAHDIEGTVVLSSTDHYTVDQLPALPDQIRGSQTEPLKCFFGAGHDHALALTRSHAIVWPYSVPASSPSPSETFTIPIPESCRDPNGPAPLGVLLSTATGEHPGLLVVIPSTGKLVYWETVSSAASLGLSRQRQSGIQGSIPGLLSGEYVTEIMNGEPSGIIVALSSGRTAHITLRDSQGRPSVLVNFFKSTAGASVGGIFGGIKNALGGGYWRKEVAAVRAGGSHQRGQRDVIIATSTGLVEIWDAHWNHGNALKKRYDARDDIAAAIPRDDEKTTTESDLKVMDFAYPTQHGSVESSASEDSWRLFMVVGSSQWLEYKKLFVIQLQLSGSDSRVLSTYPVDLRSFPAIQADSKPRIFVPKPEDTAFILLEQSLIILSLTGVEETPSSQLLLDSKKLPLPFQDTIHLRSGKEYEILGCDSEERPDNTTCATCVLMVRNFGVIRVTVFPQQGAESEVEEAQITSKHKLEQAIFFGTMAKNPLNLGGPGGLDFPALEIEQAALEICNELLRSDTRFIPTTAISLDQNLRLRAKALDDLASLLSRNGNPLSRPARWELLWGAEKLAAQRAMWKVEESFKTKTETLFLGHVIESMSDKFKTRTDADHRGTDPVRQWFLIDSYHMEHIIPWIKNAIKPRRGNSSKQARKLSEQILEASELFLAVMETAFRYRDEHAALYGLSAEFMEDGVLADGYEDLPEFWTSRGMGYTETGHLLDWELDSCRAWIQQRTSTADAPDSQVLNKIAENSARHLRILGQMHQERTRWLSAQGSPKLVDESASIEQAHVKERKWQLFKLAGIGHLHDALSLAEKFRDMGALVELVIELQDQVKGQPNQESLEASPCISGGDADVGHRISQYFEKFGEPWADAYFSRQISMGHSAALLSLRKYQSSVTRFLRKNPIYSRLSWINDVMGEADYDTAAVSLENLALGSETKLWSHQVQISLAKLSELASWEKGHLKGHPSSLEGVQRLDDFAKIDAIQETLYRQIEPFIEGAIDRKAEVELALEYFGAQLSEDRPSLHEILNGALGVLVNQQVMSTDDLIDVLTLMIPNQSEDRSYESSDDEFHQALRVLDYGHYAQRDPAYLAVLRKLIWRRCMIKDDWEAHGKSAEEYNGDSDFLARNTALSGALNSCIGEWVPRSSTGRSNVVSWQIGSGSPSFYAPLSPAEALMADSESDILASRFRPEQRARVVLDLKREDAILRRYIEAGKLDFWFQNLLAVAGAQ
ncbi:hypothetical protein NUU61_009677 [Penicillium alfredii]|uniref:Uncharacterized protein n=1 Tax=Penicillium alfredii TaxID=1506179 RepID=A0A9W9EGJ4_9EURO|nr:uncharacterized protein NUU61_009677 [Penicillium alfredii]KAJ5081413.1 hypothetical protein NUU61_009677 [Penicillium alfredii]